MTTHYHRSVRGFSLLELIAATVVMSVGSLAVFTFYLQWHASLVMAEDYQRSINEYIYYRPEPKYQRRFEYLPCEQHTG